AFTGAREARDGLFVRADGGTLFIDEIGEMPLGMQAKLLRVIQERRVRPLGGVQEEAVDVRLVSATHKDLSTLVHKGEFRQDLFYRLNVIRIHIPPLRERPEDIAVLARHFLQKHSDLQHKPLEFSAPALRWICSQPYPGNVRELENVVERAVTMALGNEITLEDLPEAHVLPGSHSLDPGRPTIPEDGFDMVAYLETMERRLLLEALERSGGNRTNAAKILGMTFRAFRYRLSKYGLSEGGDEPDATPED
ncbi:MAG: sigma-54-dependent Fis family transcriptional regulator, partial [Myxococcales bacterium]|nr:sigma-54-dependent Fis family transcriptional regulator [Myxococcales bacterium]